MLIQLSAAAGLGPGLGLAVVALSAVVVGGLSLAFGDAPRGRGRGRRGVGLSVACVAASGAAAVAGQVVAALFGVGGSLRFSAQWRTRRGEHDSGGHWPLRGWRLRLPALRSRSVRTFEPAVSAERHGLVAATSGVDGPGGCGC